MARAGAVQATDCFLQVMHRRLCGAIPPSLRRRFTRRRRCHLAAHFGVATGLPSIGVAKKPLCGRFDPPGDHPGDRTPLLDKGQQIGWALRSKTRCLPLIVSPGHRVSMAGALDWTLRCLRGYRLPEPTRLADRLASRRGEVTPVPAGEPPP